MPDTITHSVDTLPLLPEATTLLQQTTDTVGSPTISVPTGMEGIHLPSIPANENWVFVINIILFFMLATVIISSTGRFFQKIKSFFSRKGTFHPIEVPTANIFKFQLLVIAFSVIVFALLIQELFFAKSQAFDYITFAKLVGIVFCYYITKHLLFEIVGNTFFDAKTKNSFKSMYFGLMCLLATILYPILILYTYQPESWHYSLEILIIFIFSLFYIILITKILQIFFTKLLALFYIFLYLCTLEILPILAFGRICNLII